MLLVLMILPSSERCHLLRQPRLQTWCKGIKNGGSEPTPTGETTVPSGWQKIFMPMKIHFLPYENPFSSVGNSSFFGMKLQFLRYETLVSPA